MADFSFEFLAKKEEELKKKQAEEKEELGGATSDGGNPNEDRAKEEAKATSNTKKPKRPLLKKDLHPNELHEFNSMNYQFGLYCLTTDEILDPDNTYMKEGKNPEVVVIKSGGGTRGLVNRKAMTSLEKAGGRVEYFMDNLNLRSIITHNATTRATQNHKGTFEVTEPYSMGQFFETLQVAAQMAGHQSYTFATFLITIDFVGHTAENQTKRVAKRYIPIFLGQSTMNVTGAGTKYEVRFLAANASANTDSVQKIPTDVQLVGGTVQEVLQSGVRSLTTILNGNLLKREEGNTSSHADQYIILFPPADALESAKLARSGEENASVNDQTAQDQVESLTGASQSSQTVNYEDFLKRITGVSVKRSDLGEALVSQSLADGNINPIGTATLIKDKLQAGETSSAGLNEVYYPEKQVWEQSANFIPEGKRAFKFEKGTKINSIIEELVLSSDYGKNLLDTKLKDGYRPWFTILPMVFQVPVTQVENSKGRPPFIYVYKVIPYEVHASTWMSPGDISPEVPINDIRKEYHYIYTGKNKDVLEFDLTFNTRFLTPVPRDGGVDTETAQNDGNLATLGDKDTSKSVAEGEGKEEKPLVPLKSIVDSDIEIITSGMRAVPTDTKEVIARTFHKALMYSSVDLAVVELTIMGDPYYLSDSGTGNYQSAAGSTWYADENGHIDHVRSQQFVQLFFKTPYDYSANSSVMEFPTVSDENGVTIRQFSGVYKVSIAEHFFEGGQFTQKLRLLRLNSQAELDFKNKAAEDKQGFVDGTSIKFDQPGIAV